MIELRFQPNCSHNKPKTVTKYANIKGLPPIPKSTEIVCDECGAPYTKLDLKDYEVLCDENLEFIYPKHENIFSGL